MSCAPNLYSKIKKIPFALKINRANLKNLFLSNKFKNYYFIFNKEIRSYIAYVLGKSDFLHNNLQITRDI